jgi:hypothetical protein
LLYIEINGDRFLLNDQKWPTPFSSVAMPSVSLTTILYENASEIQVLVLLEHILQVFV